MCEDEHYIRTKLFIPIFASIFICCIYANRRSSMQQFFSSSLGKANRNLTSMSITDKSFEQKIS